MRKLFLILSIFSCFVGVAKAQGDEEGLEIYFLTLNIQKSHSGYDSTLFVDVANESHKKFLMSSGGYQGLTELEIACFKCKFEYWAELRKIFLIFRYGDPYIPEGFTPYWVIKKNEQPIPYWKQLVTKNSQ